ncbi:restriction endonuclease subunit S [Streptomyces sp. NPDC058620]|uniref:restriction endonuclease subunit S n=1 Tax=Streptomyces sp. NPDC058620 TaxID=3346560 RepID=UPI00365064DB
MAQVRYGLGQPPPLSDQGVAIIRATNISRGRITEANMLRAAIDDLPLDRAPLLAEGEILVVRSGAYTGDSARVSSDWVGSAPGYDMRVTPRAIESRYLAYSLLGNSALDQMTLASTRAAQPHLNAEELGEVELWVPALEEQRRIADFLNTETARIDRLMARRQAQGKRLDERAYASVSEILVPGILSSPLTQWPWTWLPEMTSDRPLVRLGYVCKLQNGLTVDGKRDVSGDVVTRPYLRVANVQAGRVDLGTVNEITVPRDIAERSTLRPGDVLMTEGGDLDKLGRGTVWQGELPGCLHQNHVFALRPAPDRLDGDYLALMTRTLHGRCYFESTGTKTTNLASTNSSKILSFPIPLPDVAVQRELAQRAQQALDSIENASQLLDRQLRLLQERRQALITAAVTGQFDVSTASGRGVDSP